MKSIVKRRYKKYAKNYLITGYLLVLLFLLLFITLTIFTNKLPVVWLSIIAVSMAMSVILGIVCSVSSIIYSDRLKRYGKAIREYRIRREYCRALRLIESQDLKAVVDIYDKHIPVHHKYKDLLYVALIHESMHSDDVNIKNKGIAKFNKLINDNSPLKVYMLDDHN